ncbi:hypothetical protein [Falsiroseomonas oryzae]|uniref:hypothetical protein n=1 Tax=Falsiroseomonas oryzae TaxID=2766473 RepID=UPI0022EB19D3|nr:hypothetical protein [Roseomonas sp. MO-31]
MTRIGLLATAMLLLPLLPEVATAQARTGDAASTAARPLGPGGSQPRMPKTMNEPLGLTPTDRTRFDPAPVPNRAIEAPPDRFANRLDPTLEPMVLQPERRQGMTFGREHLRDTGPDRPFDNILPGARLRIPFESEVRR